MKSIVIVVTLAIAIVLIGYDFVQTRLEQPRQTTAAQATAVQGGEVVQLHPESDPRLLRTNFLRQADDAGPAGSFISRFTFEGAELPGAQSLGRRDHKRSWGLNAPEWQDPTFADLSLEPADKLEKYVRHNPVKPHAPRVGHAGSSDDDLLIMEGRAEDRLSASN